MSGAGIPIAGATTRGSVMTSSYLVCELCGNCSPPAGIFSKDGVRMCYRCFFSENVPGGGEQQSQDPDTTDRDESERQKRPPT